MKHIKYVSAVVLLVFLYGCAPGHHLAFKQLSSDYSGSVLSVQGYVVRNQREKDLLEKRWSDISKAMQQQPGYISGFLSPGVGESPLWLAHSQWSSLEDLRAAFATSEVQILESKMPEQQFEHFFAHGGKGQFSALNN